jgi:hypothetical protein
VIDETKSTALGLLGLKGAIEAEPALLAAWPGAVRLLADAVKMLSPPEECQPDDRPPHGAAACPCCGSVYLDGDEAKDCCPTQRREVS